MSKTDSQIDKFKQAAKDAGCDTDEAAFDSALEKIAKANEKQDQSASPPRDRDTE